jgi:MFS family permease
LSAQTNSNAGPTVGAESLAVSSFVAKHLRHNLVMLASDYGFFGLGMTFASLATIAPAFAERLGASNLVIGMIPAVVTVGYALPPLFTANLTERMPRNLRFLLTWTTLERLPYLLLALGAYFLALESPGLTLALLLVCLALVSGVGGALTPAWLALISKVVPTSYRGRLFAFGSSLSALLGLGGSALVGYFLSAYPFPLGYTLAFGTGFLCLVISFVFLAFVREPAVAVTRPHLGFREYVGRMPEVLSRNRSFTWYLVCRMLGYLGQMSGGFYTVYALRILGATELDVALFTFIFLAGQLIANIIFGYVADHVGHKPVLVAGAIAMAASSLVAMGSQGVQGIYVVFVCYAVWIASTTVSAMVFSLEFAPPDEVPTYTGLASTLVAPAAFIAPLIGGLIADASGYPAVFAVACLAALVNAAVLLLGVRDPRRETVKRSV